MAEKGLLTRSQGMSERMERSKEAEPGPLLLGRFYPHQAHSEYGTRSNAMVLLLLQLELYLAILPSHCEQRVRL